MDIALLNYPQKSHRKKIRFPEESIELAEFIGIVFGDGGIGNDWQVVISLNSILDLGYSRYIQALIENLFKIKTTARKRPSQNTLVVVATSISLVDFMINKGAVRGNKLKLGMKIPEWILKNNNYQRAFVRGMVDTDGCMFIHKHTIKGVKNINIGLCFTSKSKGLIGEVALILRENNLNPHIHKNKENIYLYGEKAVVKYLNIIGSSNPRIFNKLKEWRDARAV